MYHLQTWVVPDLQNFKEVQLTELWWKMRDVVALQEILNVSVHASCEADATHAYTPVS
jgi:hypothetical protein